MCLFRAASVMNLWRHPSTHVISVATMQCTHVWGSKICISGLEHRNRGILRKNARTPTQMCGNVKFIQFIDGSIMKARQEHRVCKTAYKLMSQFREQRRAARLCFYKSHTFWLVRVWCPKSKTCTLSIEVNGGISSLVVSDLEELIGVVKNLVLQ